VAAESLRGRLLRETLYPHARLVRPWLKLVSTDYFRADEDFLEDLRGLRRKRDFEALADDYVQHPANRGIWRQGLNLRVSVRRARRLVYEVMETAGGQDTFSNGGGRGERAEAG
jgi:hypothetical protein